MKRTKLFSLFLLTFFTQLTYGQLVPVRPDALYTDKTVRLIQSFYFKTSTISIYLHIYQNNGNINHILGPTVCIVKTIIRFSSAVTVSGNAESSSSHYAPGDKYKFMSCFRGYFF